jgi:hypothetical protein
MPLTEIMGGRAGTGEAEVPEKLGRGARKGTVAPEVPEGREPMPNAREGKVRPSLTWLRAPGRAGMLAKSREALTVK